MPPILKAGVGDIAQWYSTCLACERSKKSKKFRLFKN
jgi:hypothetical protein